VVGLVLALLSGFSFAVSTIFMRRAVYRSGESFSPLLISVFLGMVIFGFPLFVSGKAGQLTSLSWLGVGSLAGAGVLHFILGRVSAYTSLRLIGSNRAIPILRGNILFATLLGVFFLGEPMTISLVLALSLIVGGIILISITGSSKTGKLTMTEGSLVRGLFAALGAALCWGISPILIKIGLREANSPLLATFVSYTMASIVAGGLLFYPGNSEKLHRLDRSSLIPIVIAAVATSIAQLLRYTALDYSPVSMVVPLIGADTLLVFPLSFLINREIETFGLKTIMGAIAVVTGIFLIFWTA
jgi:drug/metabolite transporter (DMT)-like permease